MENREVVHELTVLSVLHRYLIGRAAAPTGLYCGQPFMLEYIMENNGCTQRELAAATHISPASAATSLGRLEGAGFIERVTDTDDERKKHLSITESGRKALGQFHKTCHDVDGTLFRGFSAEEKEKLGGYLKRLETNILSCDIEDEELASLLRCPPGGKKHPHS